MNNTPKHFALQLGSLISLYLSLSFLLVLLFGIINLKFPDATEGYWAIESASSSVRLGIAMVIVFFPTYLVLTRLVNKERRTKNADQYLSLTKWLIYASLTLGIGALLVDLAVVIMAFLEGEITTRFIYKAAAVVVVLGAAVHYYILDARGYWLSHESKSIMFGIGAGIVAFTAVAFGFSYVESPAGARAMRLDYQQVTDLRNIQWQVDSYMSLSSSSLPATLEEAYQDSGATLPVAPEDREPYSYEVTDRGFSLCATFAYDSVPDEFTQSFVDPMARIKNPEQWNYTAGRYCFDRIVK